jgi:hypothetical protein
MNYIQKVKDILLEYSKNGEKQFDDGTLLISRAPHIAELAWLHRLYPPLSSEEIEILENELQGSIPNPFKEFLKSYSNGLNIFIDNFCLFGYRRKMDRSINAVPQPYSIITINKFEKPEDSLENYFFIGGYDDDGSHLYIDKENLKVYRCSRLSASPLNSWNSFEEMLLKEVTKISSLFDEEGKLIRDTATTPPDILRN